MVIRPATPRDAEGIREVHLKAFPTAAEADLVRELEDDGDVVISLVAEDDALVGHALFSRMHADADLRPIRALGLGPVAVTPDRQSRGLGAALIREGLERARSVDTDLVFVLGEPGYYRRFGFEASVAAPFASPYAGPYFQAVAVSRQETPAISGRAEYAPAFARLK